jgi:hypothetical protein
MQIAKLLRHLARENRAVYRRPAPLTTKEKLCLQDRSFTSFPC